VVLSAAGAAAQPISRRAPNHRDAVRGVSGSVVASAAVAHPVAIDEIH
jgi:hypothetical protein